MIAAAKRVANPGCWPTGAVALLRPLIGAGMLDPTYPVTIGGISGYSGGGKTMIADHVFANWDTDHSGTLSLDEFVAGLDSLPPLIHHHGGDALSGLILTSD